MGKLPTAEESARLIAYWSRPGSPRGEAARHLLNDRLAVAQRVLEWAAQDIAFFEAETGLATRDRILARLRNFDPDRLRRVVEGEE